MRAQRQERACLKTQAFTLAGVQTGEARKVSGCQNHEEWIGHIQKLGVYPYNGENGENAQVKVCDKITLGDFWRIILKDNNISFSNTC